MERNWRREMLNALKTPLVYKYGFIADANGNEVAMMKRSSDAVLTPVHRDELARELVERFNVQENAIESYYLAVPYEGGYIAISREDGSEMRGITREEAIENLEEAKKDYKEIHLIHEIIVAEKL